MLTAMEFPLIEHELGFLGRRKLTYVLRVIPIAIVVTLFSDWLYGLFARINDQFAETVQMCVFGCGFYGVLIRRIRRQWLNGGFTRAAVNPVGA